MPENYNKTRIARNSLFLYLRMLVTMWLNLWATRLVLVNLGADDMGVYGVVGSVVGLFSVLTAGLTTAVQRYLAFEAGKDGGDVNEVFCSCLNVTFILSAFLLILLEVVGTWFLAHAVDIPLQSREAAAWVFQFSVITCMATLVSIPYNALLVAREKLDVFAWISILQVALNWAAAYALSFLASADRLVTYALLLALISLLVRVVYQVYCHLTFEEARYHWGINRKLIKEVGRFAGISTASNTLNMITSQGIVLIVNWTFGVGLNAVYQIALQLKNAIMSFGMNIFKAISPQITKTYANGELEAHRTLVYTGSKVEIYMIFFIMIPFLFKTEYILSLWLGNVPEYTTGLCRAMVVLSMLYAGFEPIRTAVMATNRMGKFLIIPETFYLITALAGSFLVAKTTGSPVAMVLFIVVMEVLTCLFRICMAKEVSFIRIADFFRSVCLPSVGVFIMDGIFCYLLAKLLDDSLSQLTILLLVNTLGLLFIVFYIGLNRQEQRIVREFALKILTDIKASGKNKKI